MLRPRSALTLLSMLLVAAPLMAQSPWPRVPAFPAVCYTEGDSFPGRIEAAFEANLDAEGRQERINHELDDQLKAVDPAATQSHMMAYMQENPAGFKAYMAQMAQDPQLAQAATKAHRAKMQGFQKEFDALKANYAAALETTLHPVGVEMMKVLDAASGAPTAERAAAVAKYNSTYKALCEKWIIRENFPAFLTRFKAYLVGTYLPSLDKRTAMTKTSFEMAGIDSAAYQDTEQFTAVSVYLDYARTAFGLRNRLPQGL